MSPNKLKTTIAATILGLCAASTASAQEPEAERVAATASPVTPSKNPHTISNPTAWMPSPGQIHLSLGIDQNQKPAASIALGLGGLAEVGLVVQREQTRCGDCEEEDRRSLSLGTAYFKMGLAEGRGYVHMPALALMFRKAVPKGSQLFTEPSSIFSSQLEASPTAVMTAMASKTLGAAALHLGAELMAAQKGDSTTDALETPHIRPALGVQYQPAKYPETTLLADVRWVPATDGMEEWATLWNAAWGIRYQALTWAAVDLNVRHQEHEGIADALVTLGARGVFDLTSFKSGY